jgi:hypothetical protein
LGSNSTILSENASERPEIATWLFAKANAFLEKEREISENANDAYEREITYWKQNNGKGFYSGKPEVLEMPGPIATDESVTCKIDDGDISWVSYFKGEVYGYDVAKNVHYLVYVPKCEINAVNSMISGTNYLWLGVATNNGIIVFDKSSHELREIIVPEMPMQITTSSECYPGVGKYFLEEGLYFKGETGDKILLTLPDDIDYQIEFSNAKSCGTD